MNTKIKKLPLTADDVDWNVIDKLLDEKNCKIISICEERGWNQTEFKALLVSKYGDSIEFRRGRTGGVYRKEAK